MPQCNGSGWGVMEIEYMSENMVFLALARSFKIAKWISLAINRKQILFLCNVSHKYLLKKEDSKAGKCTFFHLDRVILCLEHQRNLEICLHCTLYKTVIPTEISRLMRHQLLCWVSMAVQVGCQSWGDVSSFSKISHCAAKADHV